MHLTRGSLYKAFNDKKLLFLTVLNRYEDSAVKARYRFCQMIASLMAGTVG
jgi:AcrR family transcriptional regulator